MSRNSSNRVTSISSQLSYKTFYAPKDPVSPSANTPPKPNMIEKVDSIDMIGNNSIKDHFGDKHGIV